ncbi:hypothetical protein BC332_21273 [Capsicum chinense]|nr:hypothetical protein BC332_21273 [Capsicum chinense]
MMHFGIETVEDKNWFYTMGLPDQSWTNSHIDVCFYYLRKKSKYDPNRSYKFSTVDYNFMNIISSLHDVYSADAENLMAGGHVAHVNEYINEFCMHASVPWHTTKDIYIPVNIKEKHHWVLAILSFSERCILLYDSYKSSGHYLGVLDVIEKLAAIIPLCLEHCDFYVKKGMHVENHRRYKDKDSSDMFDVLFQENLPQQLSRSFGHYAAILAEIEKIAKIISSCLQTCNFYVKKGIDHQSHPRYKDKESSDIFNVLFQDDLPQQPNGSLDCGVFMVMYAECLSYGHKVIASEFDPNALRTRYAALLWDYGIREQKANAISDVKAPVRPARQNRITSVAEVVDV